MTSENNMSLLNKVISMIRDIYDFVDIETIDYDDLIVILRSESPIELTELIQRLEKIHEETGLLLKSLEASISIETEDNKATAYLDIFLQFMRGDKP